MYSETSKPVTHSAAWRISLWGALAFACGSLIVFMFLHAFVARDIQRRTDTWLSGEVLVLSDVAQRTPKDRLYGRVVGEVAELASREVPDRLRPTAETNHSVFLLQTSADGKLALWVGSGNGQPELEAVRSTQVAPDMPFDLRLKDVPTPFRVAAVTLNDGSHMYLGLSKRDETHVLHHLRVRFLLLWLLDVLLGSGIVYLTSRRTLLQVGQITQAASRIGESDLSKRVPGTGRNDEVGQLASTLNRMLDRIEKSIHQLHTITNSLAHDLRSPLTAIRVKLEISLAADPGEWDNEALVSAIEEVDRLTELLNRSLDVAEARADALRLNRTTIDLDQLLRVMTELYEPCMSENGLRLQLRSMGPVEVSADTALLYRMMVNLFDNELKHLSAPCAVTVSLGSSNGFAWLVLQDDGAGFASDVGDNLFKPGVKGQRSGGKGLGLAFVEAVVNAHSGEVTALNRQEGGIQITIKLPLASEPPAAGSEPRPVSSTRRLL